MPIDGSVFRPAGQEYTKHRTDKGGVGGVYELGGRRQEHPVEALELGQVTKVEAERSDYCRRPIRRRKSARRGGPLKAVTTEFEGVTGTTDCDAQQPPRDTTRVPGVPRGHHRSLGGLRTNHRACRRVSPINPESVRLVCLCKGSP